MNQKTRNASIENDFTGSEPSQENSGGIGFWEYLATNTISPHKYGDPLCKTCFGMGILVDPQGGGWDEGAFELCGCLKKQIRGDGKPPYEYYDENSNSMQPCPTKRARVAMERIRRLQLQSGIPKRYGWKFLNSIDFQSSPLSLNVALSHAVETILDYGKKEAGGLYFHGPTGSGKTLLSCAVLNELLRIYQIRVKYAKISRDVLGKLKASFNPNSEIYGEGRKIEEELAGVPALVIDDFGVHRESDWVNSVLYDLIDARYENNLLTIITSNEPMDAWKDISQGRVYSRLREMCVEIHIDAPDYRLRQARQY